MARGMETQRDRRMERKRYGCTPSPLHKAHPGASCKLLKEGTCLSALAWAGELQGVFPLGSNHVHSSSDSIPHPFLVSAESGTSEQCWRWERSLEVTGPMTH